MSIKVIWTAQARADLKNIFEDVKDLPFRHKIITLA